MTSDPSPPRVVLSQVPGVVIARLTGCRFVDESNAATVGRELAPLAEIPATRIHLDLAEVEFVTSVGLVELIILNRKLRSAGIRLTLTHLRPDVRLVLSATRLDTVVCVAPDYETTRADPQVTA